MTNQGTVVDAYEYGSVASAGRHYEVWYLRWCGHHHETDEAAQECGAMRAKEQDAVEWSTDHVGTHYESWIELISEPFKAYADAFQYYLDLNLDPDAPQGGDWDIELADDAAE